MPALRGAPASKASASGVRWICDEHHRVHPRPCAVLQLPGVRAQPQGLRCPGPQPRGGAFPPSSHVRAVPGDLHRGARDSRRRCRGYRQHRDGQRDGASGGSRADQRRRDHRPSSHAQELPGHPDGANPTARPQPRLARKRSVARTQSMSRIYLDDAGSAPVLSEVAAALRELSSANPSSLHAEGRSARTALDRARDSAADALDADRTEITFTSSGTESINLALFGAARRLPKGGLIVTWAAEHQAVLGAVRRLDSEGHSVEIAGVDGSARADADSIPPGAALVSIGLANNELGTIQPVSEVIARAHEVGALVHVDACAGPRWIPVPPGADLVSFSGHKLGAGRGGILFVRDGVRLEPLLYGGPQEWGRRAGFEDVSAGVAIAAALSLCVRDRDARARAAGSQAARLRE